MSDGTVYSDKDCIGDIVVVSIPMELSKAVNILLCLWLPKLLSKSDRAVDRITISQCLTYCLTMGSVFIFNLTYHYSGWKSRNLFCYFSTFAMSFGPVYSFVAMVAIAVLRYLYCIHPFFMRNQKQQKITMFAVILGLSLTLANSVYVMAFPQRYLVKCLGLKNYRQEYRVPFLQVLIVIAIYCYCRIAFSRFCKSNVSTRETKCMISVMGSTLNLLGMLLTLIFGRSLMNDPCGPSGIMLVVTAICGLTQVMYILTSNEIRRNAWNDVKNIVSRFFICLQIPLKSQLLDRRSLANVLHHVSRRNAVSPKISVISPSDLPKTLASKTYHEVMQTTENPQRFVVSERFAEVAEMHDRNVNIGTDAKRSMASRSSHRMFHSDENLRQIVVEAVKANLTNHKNANDNSFLRDEMRIHLENAGGQVRRHCPVWLFASQDIASAACDDDAPSPESTHQTLPAFGPRRHSLPSLPLTRPCHSSVANREIKAAGQVSTRLI